jgi:hypothetical protein
VFLIKGADDEAPCAGLSSTWDRAGARLRIRVASACLHDGDYGAIRGWFLTEESGGGGDIDYAHSLEWTSRGLAYVRRVKLTLPPGSLVIV